MLSLTDHAARIIRMIPEQGRYADSAGLRIALPAEGERAGSGTPFKVRAADAPEQNDRLLDVDGARVFLGPVAARQLASHELDASLDAYGRIEFRVSAR